MQADEQLPETSYKVAEVKAACYDNILTRCEQGQAGWGGDWCVGPGADKTCEARAQQICKCGNKPGCRGEWGSSLEETPRWFAGDANRCPSSLARCRVRSRKSRSSIASRFTRRERPERGIGAGVPPCNARDVSLTVLHRGKFSRRVGESTEIQPHRAETPISHAPFWLARQMRFSE